MNEKKWSNEEKHPNPMKKHPITCPYCGKDSGFTEESLMYYVIPQGGIHCKNCGKLILEGQQIFC